MPSRRQVFTAEALIGAQGLVRRMPVGEQVVEAILDLVRACRPGEPEGRELADSFSWGPGPRAAQALMLMVRARALLDGRLAPSVSDVADLAQAQCWCTAWRCPLPPARGARRWPESSRASP